MKNVRVDQICQWLVTGHIFERQLCKSLLSCSAIMCQSYSLIACTGFGSDCELAKWQDDVKSLLQVYRWSRLLHLLWAHSDSIENWGSHKCFSLLPTYHMLKKLLSHIQFAFAPWINMINLTEIRWLCCNVKAVPGEMMTSLSTPPPPYSIPAQTRSSIR